MNFDLSNAADTLILYNAFEQLIDSLNYFDSWPWPDNADGEGYTLELVNYNKNNALSKNWAASALIGGTPGTQNSMTVGEIL